MSTPGKSLLGSSLNSAAGAVLVALLLLAACSSRSETASLAGAPTERRCRLADEPDEPLWSVVDSAEFVQAFEGATISHPGAEVLFSVAFGVDGAASHAVALESDLGQEATERLQAEFAEHVRWTVPGDPWGVRIRARAGRPTTLSYERSTYCPPVFIGIVATNRRRALPRGVWYVVEWLVDRDGVVTEAKMRRSTGDLLLDSYILEQVHSQRYLPALLDGEPVDVWLEFNSSY
jgi:hypothetical protein